MKLFSETDLVITDDIDPLPGDFFEKSTSQILEFTPFPERDEEKHYQMRFLSVLKFYNLFDLLTDFRTKLENGYLIFVFTKRIEELGEILLEEKIPFHQNFPKNHPKAFSSSMQDAEHIPRVFKSRSKRFFSSLTERIFQLHRSRKQKSLDKLNLEFLTSLKVGDYVVHMDHGIGHFWEWLSKKLMNTHGIFEIAYTQEPTNCLFRLIRRIRFLAICVKKEMSQNSIAWDR